MYRIEPYRPELRSRLLDLQSHHWGLDREINERYFAWKYEQNPYLDDVLIYVATLDGEVVGMRGAFGACWVDGAGDSVGALGAGDLVVRPDHRNRFLPRRIMEGMAEDLGARGYRYLLNLSASRFTHLVSRRQGWELAVEHAVAQRWPPRSLLLRASRRLREAIGAGRGPAPLDAFDRAAEATRRRSPGALAVERASEPAEMADLCARSQRSPDSIRQRHDQRFLEWRFRNPFAHYRFLYWRESSGLEAYLVVQQHATGDRSSLALVDWAFASAEAMTRLIATALELAGSWPSVAWLGGRPQAEHALFLRARFVHYPIRAGDRRRPGLLVKRLVSAGAPPLRPSREGQGESWAYHMIDGDSF
jgi:GNAT superfamily N-acetyltransferase